MLVGVAKVFIGPFIHRISFREKERGYILPSHASTQPQFTPKRAAWANLKWVFSPQSLACNSAVCWAMLSACDVLQCGIFGHSTAWCRFPTGRIMACVLPGWERMNEWMGEIFTLVLKTYSIPQSCSLYSLKAFRIWRLKGPGCLFLCWCFYFYYLFTIYDNLICLILRVKEVLETLEMGERGASRGVHELTVRAMRIFAGQEWKAWFSSLYTF